MIFRYYARYAALIGLLNIILERKDDPICRIEFHFLELGKVDPNKPIEEMSQIERLAVYLRYADDENYKGAAQEKREIAKNFKQAGITIEVIAENTGLSCEEVEKL